MEKYITIRESDFIELQNKAKQKESEYNKGVFVDLTRDFYSKLSNQSFKLDQLRKDLAMITDEFNSKIKDSSRIKWLCPKLNRREIDTFRGIILSYSYNKIDPTYKDILNQLETIQYLLSGKS